MAMFAPIPLPDGSNQVFKDVMDYFETLQQRNAQQQQFAQNLKISKEAESRAQQLLPYQIQQYKDTHNKDASDLEIKQMYNGLIKQAYNQQIADMKAGNNASFGGTPAITPGAMPGANQPVPQAPNVASPEAAPNLAQTASMPALPMPMQLSDMIQKMGVPNSNVPANASAPMPSPPPMPVVEGGATPPINSAAAGAPLQAPQSAPMANPAASNQGGIYQGETVIRAGNPALSKLDAMAGILPQIPKPAIHFAPNGTIYKQYPSGAITMIQAPTGSKTVNQLTPEEKVNYETQVAEGKQEAKAHAAQNMQVENSNRDLALMYKQATDAEKILKSDPYLTGVGWKIPLAKAAAGSKKLGDLQSAFGALQAQLSKLNASRPGIGTIQWASTVKPDTGNNAEYNLGMIRELKKHIRDQIDADNEIYYRNKKTKLPHPDDNETVTLTNPETKEKMKLTKKEARERGADV